MGVILLAYSHGYGSSGGLLERLLLVVVHAAIWRVVFALPLKVVIPLAVLALVVVLFRRRYSRAHYFRKGFDRASRY